MRVKYIVEGYADEVLMSVFRIPLKHIYIAKSISGVARMMKNAKDDFIVMVGTIDDDKKNVPNYFRKFKTQKETESAVFKYLPQTQQYLIIVKPAIEKFIIMSSLETKIFPTSYNIPVDFKKFRDFTKNENIKKNNDFKNFLKAVYNEKSKSFVEFVDFLKEIHKKHSLPDYW